MQHFRENTQPYIGAEDSHRHYAQYAEMEPRLVALYEQVLALKAGLRGRIDGGQEFVWFAPYVDGPPAV